MAAAKPAFRPEHIGSLRRPERQISARERQVVGEIPKADLTRTQDECFLEVVKSAPGAAVS